MINTSGTADSGTNYDRALLVMYTFQAFAEAKSTGITYMNTINIGDSTESPSGLNGYFFNPYDSSSYTFSLAQNTYQTNTALGSSKIIGVHKVAETIRGINLSSTETMNAVEVSVYGVK